MKCVPCCSREDGWTSTASTTNTTYIFRYTIACIMHNAHYPIAVNTALHPRTDEHLQLISCRLYTVWYPLHNIHCKCTPKYCTLETVTQIVYKILCAKHWPMDVLCLCNQQEENYMPHLKPLHVYFLWCAVFCIVNSNAQNKLPIVCWQSAHVGDQNAGSDELKAHCTMLFCTIGRYALHTACFTLHNAQCTMLKATDGLAIVYCASNIANCISH